MANKMMMMMMVTMVGVGRDGRAMEVLQVEAEAFLVRHFYLANILVRESRRRRLSSNIILECHKADLYDCHASSGRMSLCGDSRGYISVSCLPSVSTTSPIRPSTLTGIEEGGKISGWRIE